MTDPNSKVQVWHIGRGIVFSSSSEVVYPRLPIARFHSSGAVPGGGDDKVTLPDVCAGSSSGRQTDQSVRGPTASVAGEPSNSPDRTVAPMSVTGNAEGEPSGEGKRTKVEVASSEPPFTPLDFKVPAGAFREALHAEPGAPESFWSYSLYRGPGGDDDSPEGAKVKVHYCKSKHTTERVLQHYFMNEKVLGFDLEWSPSATRFHSARQNVSLVQLASPSRIALFHLSLYPKNDDLVAPSLRKIMEDPEVTKVGVAIRGDCTRLRNFLGINSRGTFELSHLYKLVKHSASKNYSHVNKRLVSLATQVQEYLRLPLFKGPDVRSSDWTQPLQMGQIICKDNALCFPILSRRG